ncbi:hypothetical protein GH714_022127 [Hevea brasiliensis]|uniref:Uncharacterized protein n=1 Tax=Hevea brasiliensis TaxID=3981 RepID=A0A6A6NIH0_HEVBR|nr:hypothetical protein GH714_002012 [Hevea brasiliensis]KAF2324994.1 hypothetical protein GH714_022127 [Hevea brasiliensis]
MYLVEVVPIGLFDGFDVKNLDANNRDVGASIVGSNLNAFVEGQNDTNVERVEIQCDVETNDERDEGNQTNDRMEGENVFDVVRDGGIQYEEIEVWTVDFSGSEHEPINEEQFSSDIDSSCNEVS